MKMEEFEVGDLFEVNGLVPLKTLALYTTGGDPLCSIKTGSLVVYLEHVPGYHKVLVNDGVYFLEDTNYTQFEELEDG